MEWPDCTALVVCVCVCVGGSLAMVLLTQIEPILALFSHAVVL